MHAVPRAYRAHKNAPLSSILATRSFSAAPQKPSAAQLVKRLRETVDGLSISKAREALTASENDVEKALQWLSSGMAAAGAKKAAKSVDRVTAEGLIGVSVLSAGTAAAPGHGSVRAAMIELNCETDFVARNSLFTELLRDIGHTAAFLAEHDEGAQEYITSANLPELEGAPLMLARDPSAPAKVSIGDAIRETIAKTGELIVLRRAVTVSRHAIPATNTDLALRLSSYAHGGADTAQGRAASLILTALKSPSLATLLKEEEFLNNLSRIERSLARQIVGFNASHVRAPPGETDESALYGQPFGMLAGATTDLNVGEYLKDWALQQKLIEGQEEGGIDVLEMAHWKVGEALN